MTPQLKRRQWSATEQRVLERAESPRATEAEIMDAILLVLNDPYEYADCYLSRNNVGVLVDKETDRYVRFGVGGKGGADLIGMFTHACSGGAPRTARFIAAEIKSARGSQTPEQQAFQRLVESRGGSYAVLRSVREAREWVAKLRGEM